MKNRLCEAGCGFFLSQNHLDSGLKNHAFFSEQTTTASGTAA
jgi:hypothetical protein